MKNPETLRQHGARYVVTVLDLCDGDKTLACAVLDITRPTLQRYLEVARGLGIVRAPDEARPS